jgi:hypothetical protein
MASFLEKEVLAEKGRVTAGIPGLFPEQRAIKDYRGRQREKVRNAVHDAESKKKALTAKDGDRPTNLHEAQEGVALDPYMVMCRLRKMNNNLHFEPSMHDKNKMGIYLLDPLAETGKRFICGMERDRKIPEFSVRETVEKDVRTGQTDRFKETRGWRTVLYRLIKAKLISKTKAEILFGPPSRDSKLWQLLTN